MKKWIHSNVTRHFALLLLFLVYSTLCTSQKLKAPRWEIYGSGTLVNYTNQNTRLGYGMSVDYYLTKKFSIRGGLLANNNYLTVSIAPLFWALLNTKSDNKSHDSHFLRDIGTKNALKVYLVLLFMSDGFTYNIKASKNFYVCPYIAPLQYYSFGTNGKSGEKDVLTSSVGIGFKRYLDKKFVIYAGAEFSSAALYKDPRWGYRLNTSIGYVLNSK